MIRATLADLETVNSLTGGDFTGFLSEPKNVCLLAGGGAAFFGFHEPGIYEVHCHFTERGKAVRDTSKRILEHMRDEYGARTVYAPIPDTSRHVKAYVRWLSFKPEQAIEIDGAPAELFKLEM